MAEVTNIGICPSCGAENIEGADTCQNCTMDLRTVDVPETAQLASESPFLDPIANLRMARAAVIPATTTVAEAVTLVAAQSSGAVIIADGARIVGIFTERDVLKKVAGREGLNARPITDIMTPDPVILRGDDTVATALNKMGSGGFRHIPVVSGGKVVGIVTARETLRWVMSNYFE